MQAYVCDVTSVALEYYPPEKQLDIEDGAACCLSAIAEPFSPAI